MRVVESSDEARTSRSLHRATTGTHGPAAAADSDTSSGSDTAADSGASSATSRTADTRDAGASTAGLVAAGSPLNISSASGGVSGAVRSGRRGTSEGCQTKANDQTRETRKSHGLSFTLL